MYDCATTAIRRSNVALRRKIIESSKDKIEILKNIKNILIKIIEKFKNKNEYIFIFFIFLEFCVRNQIALT